MLENFLRQKKATILKRWFDMILETYPPDTSRFLKHEKNQFANPVGNTILLEIEDIYEELLRGRDSEKLSDFLDRIIKIRAIQDFSPAQAVAFVFHLKSAIREELGGEICGDHLFEELLEFELRIDKLALLAFNTYMKCREKVYQIRVNEIRNRTFRLLERVNLIGEISEQELDISLPSDY
ncbi:MAG: RsbRD N-terminal domain-containing protein [Thermodesulfobacteriota bacterium]